MNLTKLFFHNILESVAKIFYLLANFKIRELKNLEKKGDEKGGRNNSKTS